MRLSYDQARAVAEGTIGLTINVLALTVFLFRLWQHIKDEPCHWSKKRIIHSLLVWFCVLQSIRYSFFLHSYREEDPEELYGYTCHLLSIVLLVVAYTLFVTLWGDTLRLENGCSKAMMVLVVGFTLFFLSLVLTLVIDVWIEGHMEHMYELLPYKMIIWAQALIFIISSTGFLAYGLYAHYQMKSTEKWHEILARLNVVMFTCSLCALLRVSMLILSYMENQRGTSYIPNRPIIYLLLSQWIPFYGILCVIQYVTRKPEVTSWTDTALLWNSVATTSRRSGHTGIRIDEEEDEDGLIIVLKKSPSTPGTPLYGLSTGSQDSDET